jgi:hypothetical protein
MKPASIKPVRCAIYQDPRRNGVFSINDGFRGSGRLDGGRDRDRTGDPPRWCLKPNSLGLLEFLKGFVTFFAVCSRRIVAVRCRRCFLFSEAASPN